MMDSAVAYFALDSCWADEVRDFSDEAVDRNADSDGLHAWDM
jgi:hypothetical protein